jgi:uncharacterized protein (TIGR02099 family)
MQRGLSLLARWGLGLCALLAILLALYVSLGRLASPWVGEYRAEVEQRAQAALGMPVHIGRLEGRWSGLAPIFLAHDVMVGEGASALRLDQVRLAPALWHSLLARSVRLAHLELSGLQLTLAQNAAGAWQLKGLPLRDEQPFDPVQTLNQLQQVEQLSVLDSQLTLQAHDQAPVTLTYIGAHVRTALGDQRLDLRLTLPDGQLAALAVTAQAWPEQWREANAQLYASLPSSDWAPWLPTQLTGAWKLARLQAGGEFWLDWRQGQAHSGAVRLRAPAVQAGHAERAPISVSDLALVGGFQRTAEGLDGSVDGLAFTYGKTPWQSRLKFQQHAASGDWQVQADRLDLAPLAAVANALGPLPQGLLTTLEHLKPTGHLRNVRLDIRPAASGDQRLGFAANLDQVGFAAYHGAPAAGNVSGAINGDLGHGELRLNTQNFMLHLEPIFAKPWYYREAAARLTWTLSQDAFTLAAPVIKVVGEEGKVAADFLIRLPFDGAHEPYMDLRVGMTEGDARFTGKYLPAVLSPALDEWLRDSIKAGKVDEGYFQYQGSIAHAAPEHSRSISLFFKVRDATLDFQPGWPALSQVDGRVYVEDGSVSVLASKGRLLNTQLREVKVDVPHVEGDGPAHLLVNGGFDGKLADGLKILQEAPIGTGSMFAGWQGEGPLSGRLKLDIPLAKGQEPKVLVDFATEGARLKLAEPALELTQLKAAMRFDSEKGLSSPDVTAQAFGQAVSAQIFAEGKPGSPLTRIAAQSRIDLPVLTDWLQFKPALPASGSLPYQLQVFLGDNSRLSVESDLNGLKIDLPAPFGKRAEDSRPSTFTMDLQGAERRFDARYAGLATLAYAAPAGNLTTGRGELLLGSGDAQLPSAKGLRVRGALDELDLEPWKQQAQQFAGNDATGGGSSSLSGVDLQVGHLKGMGLDLDQARLQLQRGDSAWNLRLDSQQVTGTVALPDSKNSPIKVTLQTLRLPPVDPKAVVVDNPPDTPDPLAAIDPSQIPLVDVSIANVTQGDDPVGAWSLKLRPTAKGLAITDIDMGLKGLRLQGTGTWEGTPGASSSWFRGRADGKNLADVLQAWHFAPSVTSQEFTLDIDGRWPGSPAWIALKRYSGSLDARLERGQLVEVEGGAAALRVFGLLNFNSIGRRLRLDFSDLLGKGLGYDRIKGLLVASNGVYVTREPITMVGPSSNFELNGTLDMVADRVDASLLVTLPISTNLPIAALLVGAPAIGGALLLVDKLLGDRVARLASVQYRVEGPWKDPKISFDKPLQRKR